MSACLRCTYIRYLRAYIWVPIYRYQMVNERVDAKSGRPQLAATQSFVYRGAVCATARTGWARSGGGFFFTATEYADFGFGQGGREEERGTGSRGWVISVRARGSGRGPKRMRLNSARSIIVRIRRQRRQRRRRRRRRRRAMKLSCRGTRCGRTLRCRYALMTSDQNVLTLPVRGAA